MINREGQARTSVFDTALSSIPDCASIALSSIPDCAYVMNREGRFIYANPALLELWGLTLDQALGKTVADLNYPPEQAERIQRQVRHVVETGERVKDEMGYTAAAGTSAWYEYTLKPIVTTDGTVEAVAGSTRDITDRRRAEEALRGSEERQRLAAELVGLSHYEWDLTTGAIGWDVRMKEMWGLPPDARVDFQTLIKAVHPDDRATVEAAINGSFDPAGNGGYALDYRVIGVSDGVERWVSKRGRTFFENGRPVRMIGTAMEVTDRKRAEAAMLGSERRLQLALSAANLGIWEWDLGTDKVRCSDRALAVVGIAREQFNGDASVLRALIHPDDLHVHRARAEATGTGKPFACEYRIVRPDGQVRWVANFGRTEQDGAGKAARMIGAVADITDRKRSEEALRQSEERFRRYFELGLIGMSISSPTKGLLEVNQKLCEILGYSRDELLRTSWAALTHPDDVAADVRQFERVMAGEIDGYTMEKRWVRKDGRVIDSTLSVNCLRKEGGAVDYFVSLIQDITDRKHAEEKLRQSEAQIRQLLAILPAAVYTCDAAGRITFYNRRCAQLWGREPAIGDDREKFCGSTRLWQTDGTPVPNDQSPVARAIRDGAAVRDSEIVMERPDGTRVVVIVNIDPLRDAEGRVVGAINVFEDRTERKRVEEALRESREREKAARIEAERAMTTKDEFLAVVSHELRTPLGAIMLWSEMLDAGNVDSAKFPAVFKSIRQCAEAQHQLIEDLLDVSRMLSGEFRLNVQEAELAPVVRAAVETVRPTAEAKGIRVETDVDPRAGRVRADPDRIQQVVWNLLSNAVKFTGGGGRVSVGLRRLAGSVEIRVSDTGKGIHPEFLPHVFERFRQADASTTRAHGGLGLGLAITQQLVELHGGHIRAESPGEGKGATFTLELPLQDVWLGPRAPSRGGPAAARPFAPSPVLKGARVLVVDDDAQTRTVVRWLLEQCEAEVTAVNSAAEALDAYRASVGGRPYDALVSDIGMSDQDGYELIRNVRAMEQETAASAPIPAVALTAYAGEEDRLRAFAAGFQTYLAKPVGPAELVDVVAEAIGRGGDSHVGR